jgi:hypothetical protein
MPPGDLFDLCGEDAIMSADRTEFAMNASNRPTIS